MGLELAMFSYDTFLRELLATTHTTLSSVPAILKLDSLQAKHALYLSAGQAELLCKTAHFGNPDMKGSTKQEEPETAALRVLHYMSCASKS